jgi:hypothetical protein
MRLSKIQLRRLLVAFLISPLTPGAIVMLIAIGGGRLGEGLWASMIVLPMSYGVMLVPGMPLYWIVRRLRWASLWSYMTVGLICAFAGSVVLWRGTFAERFSGRDMAGWTPFIAFCVAAGIFGLLTGVVFWKLEQPTVGDAR